jgi:hypothetical protein
MSVIDPEGLFNGDRLRRCSNAAQLHWPRLFFASDGFARLEINYARIVGRAYPTFNPVPPEAELQACVEEYAKNYLLFLYWVGGQVWGQWDTRKELLPRYKTAADRRSPIPPEPAFTEWKQSYREENKVLPKCFGNISETFLHGVGVGVGETTTTCAFPKSGNARVRDFSSPNPKPPTRTVKPKAPANSEWPEWKRLAWMKLLREDPKRLHANGAKEQYSKRVLAEANASWLTETHALQLKIEGSEFWQGFGKWLNGALDSMEAGLTVQEAIAGGKPPEDTCRIPEWKPNWKEETA